MNCNNDADDDNNVDISRDEFSCTDVEKENSRLIDKHHIGDFFFVVSVFHIVPFVENSPALPMLSSLCGKQ